MFLRGQARHREGRRKRRPRLSLKVDGIEVVFDKTIKILGVLFDEDLNWKSHAGYVRAKVLQRVGLLNRICGKAWGVLPDTAVHVYKVWVRPMIEYASAVWGDISPATFERTIAPIQRMFLARSLGVRYCAPGGGVQAEVGVPPLDLRRDTATMMYRARLALRACNHSVKSLFERLDRDASERLVDGRRSSVHVRARALGAMLTPEERGAGFRGLAMCEARRWQASWVAARRPADGPHHYRNLRRTVPPTDEQRKEDSARRGAAGRAVGGALTGLRLGSSDLNGHLAHHGLVQASTCTQCAMGVEETTEHYLLVCPKFTPQRRKLAAGTDAVKNHDVRALLCPDEPMARRAANPPPSDSCDLDVYGIVTDLTSWLHAPPGAAVRGATPGRAARAAPGQVPAQQLRMIAGVEFDVKEPLERSTRDAVLCYIKETRRFERL